MTVVLFERAAEHAHVQAPERTLHRPRRAPAPIPFAEQFADTEATGPGADDPVADEQAERSDFGELDALRTRMRTRPASVDHDAAAPDTIPVPAPGHAAQPPIGYSPTEGMFDLERTHRWLGWVYPAVATLAAVVSIAVDKGWI